MIDDLSREYQDLTDKIGERWNGLTTMQKLALKALLDQAGAVLDRRQEDRRKRV